MAACVYWRENTNSDVSRAAELYAAEKVEQMMLKMSSRTRSTPKSNQYQNDRDRMLDSTGDYNDVFMVSKGVQKKGSAIKAAEDLAAARVEAMMAALSTNQFAEGEI